MTTEQEFKESEEEFIQLPIEDSRKVPYSESLFKQVIYSSPHPVIITDQDGEIIFYNNSAGDFIETERNNEDSQPGDQDVPCLSEYIRRINAGSETECKYCGPVEVTDRYGKTRILSLDRTILTDRFNSYFCFQCTDMTDKVLSERALIRSEKDKTLILNSIHENLVFYDQNYRIVWANQEPADSVGLKPGELKGRLCYELWYNRDSPCTDCTIKKALETGHPLVEEKVKADGKNVKVAAYPVFNDEGDIIGAVESVLDISRRKKAELALDEALKKYRDLFTTMTNGFVLHEIITDESGRPYDFRFLDVNPAFEDMTGLFSSEMIGKTVLELFPDYNTEWIERYGKVSLTGIPDEFNDYNRAFGKHYHIYTYSPKKGQFATIFSDISDLVALRKEHNSLMMQINRNFEQLAILNDEIRNPLQVITGYAMMEDSDCSEKIISQIHVIDKLINELDKRWLESDKIREYLMKHHRLY